MRRDKLTRRRSLGLLLGLLLGSCASLSGCLAAMAQAISTGDPYPLHVQTMAAPAQGMARLFVYTEAKLAEAISIDENVYQSRGKTFFAVDLPAGEHLVTGSGIYTGMFSANPKYGTSRLTLQLEPGAVSFVRVADSGRVEEVTREAAEQALAELPFCKSAGIVEVIAESR